MAVTRNLILFLLIAIVSAACGGGSSALSNTDGISSGGGSTVSSSATPITYGSVTLQWSAPTTWADNTAAPPGDIASYRLYYGQSPTNTPNFINISGSSTTQYTVTLPSGTYYFRISAIDSNGYEGLRSAALQKTL